MIGEVEMLLFLTLYCKKCSRYQFECRWTGECIAIYNACDGIPQCADGSDEGPELDCPPPEVAVAGVLTTAAPQTPSVQSVNNPSPVHPQHVYDVNTQPKVPPLPPVNSQPLYRPQAAPQEPPRPQQVAPPHQVDEADFLRQIPESRNMNPRIQYEQYMPQIPVQNQASWIPHQSNQIAPVVPQYPDKNTHIFNHKDNGLQVPEGAEYSPVQYAEGISRYPKITNYYGENYRQPLQQENWPDDIRYNISPRYPPEIPPILGLPGNNRKEPISYKSTPPIQSEDKKIDGTANPKHVQDKMAHDLKYSKHNMEHDSSVQNANLKTEKPVKHEQYPDAIAYKLTEADNQDGEAQVPKGAVLSLSIGMIVTCVMAIMIGCRLRVVRRRLRRGGKGFAHDADYLVNGMYL